MRAKRHPSAPFPWAVLRAPLREDEREDLARATRKLLRFDRTLERWRPVQRAPDATPFVSLYANGRLCGCYGSDEGEPPARLARAFLRAAHDGRFSPITAAERGVLDVQISYPRRPRLLDPETAADDFEVAREGLAFVPAPGAGGRPVNLLPHVARDERLGPRALLSALLRKSGSTENAARGGAIYAFETEDVVVRSVPDRRRPRGSGTDAAAAWLASLVDEQGAVTFAIDPRSRGRVASGQMHLGRAAVVVQALAAHGSRPALVAQARRRLEEDVRAGLRGSGGAGWPDDPDLVAGTLALAILAGASLVPELVELVGAQRGPRAAWHAAQVVAALGALAPADLWKACVDDLDRSPFAPWTLLAADARGDRAVRAKVAGAVASGLRTRAPYRGGASITHPPETALTALAVEALARHPAPWSRAAAARGREFIGRMQLVGGRITAALAPALAHGAFSASPSIDLLRCDVTAHALLAMMAG